MIELKGNNGNKSLYVFYLGILLLVFLYSCNFDNKPSSENSLQDSLVKLIPRTAKNRTSNNESGEILSFPIIDSLKKLLSISDTIQHSYGEQDTLDHVADLNTEIVHTLDVILKNRKITGQNLDTILNHPNLGIVHSDDGKLWIFNWYENTGGTFKSNTSMIMYKNASGQFNVGYDDSETSIGGDQNNAFSSNGAWFERIYKLPCKTRNLYLCTGSGIGCTTCIYSTAVVVELTKEGVNFNYPAFIDCDYTQDNTNPSYFTLRSRWNHIEKFEFNEKTQTLNFEYITDDNTPIVREEDEKEELKSGKMVFRKDRFYTKIR